VGSGGVIWIDRQYIFQAGTPVSGGINRMEKRQPDFLITRVEKRGLTEQLVCLLHIALRQGDTPGSHEFLDTKVGNLLTIHRLLI